MKNNEHIPYPSEKEIQKQISIIVQTGLPTKKLTISSFYKQIGIYNLFPNRHEWLFTGISIVSILLVIWLSLDIQETITPAYFAFLFMLSPFIFISTACFSFYDKKENRTFELEMTTKYTIFQLICLRMLLFSGLSIVVNTSISLWLSYMLHIEFLRLWLLSLTGLFLFGIGFFMTLRKGQVIRKMIAYTISWVLLNSCLVLFAHTFYMKALVQLPTIVYGCLVILLLALFVKMFQQTYLRKQEGVWLC